MRSEQTQQAGKGILANNNKGFTLVETMIVVSVISALLFGLYAVPELMARVRANRDAATISEIASSIQNRYMNKGSYNGLTTTVAITWKLIPDNLVLTAATAANHFGGAVTVTSADADATHVLSWALVPTKECLKISSAIAAQFTDVTVGGTSIFTSGVPDDTKIGTQCNSAAAVTMTFKRGK